MADKFTGNTKTPKAAKVVKSPVADAAPVEKEVVVSVVRDYCTETGAIAKVVRAKLRSLGFSAPYDAKAIDALTATEAKEAAAKAAAAAAKSDSE